MKPVILNLNKPADRKKLATIKRKSVNLRTVGLDSFFEEISRVRNPHIQDKKVIKNIEKKIRSKFENTLAVYLPWKEVMCLMPSKKIFFELTTTRNRQLINIEEQNDLRKTVVAFFGLSVGSQAATTWMLESRADNVKIVDYDTIDVSNLNRMRFGIDTIGKLKTDVTSETLYEINPFANVFTHTKARAKDIKSILSRPQVDVIVDEIDDLESKIILRKLAKKMKIPLISAADVGDNVVVDIERYDLGQPPEMFLGRLPQIEKVNLKNLTQSEKKKLIINLVGFEAQSEAMLDSIMAIGGSITTWPQLGATATIAGGVITTVIKKIIMGEKVLSGRYYFSLDKVLESDYSSDTRSLVRDKKIKKINYLLSKY